jgi:hypothetical protein
MTLDRDTGAADALLTDLYLDALLAGAVLERDGEPRLDPAARDAADRLRRDLFRVHPSFRFEERLATRLAEAAAALRVPVAVGAEGHLVPFRPIDGEPAQDGLDLELVPGSGPPLGPDGARRPPARPLLIGGALTSAALSIAGAAWVAWRLGRPRADTPMARAARAVREARELGPGIVSTATGATRPRSRRSGRLSRGRLD